MVSINNSLVETYMSPGCGDSKPYSHTGSLATALTSDCLDNRAGTFLA